jgi:hypothetical protein
MRWTFGRSTPGSEQGGARMGAHYEAPDHVRAVESSLGMGLDLLFQLRELVVELVDRQIKGGALLAAGLVGT